MKEEEIIIIISSHGPDVFSSTALSSQFEIKMSQEFVEFEAENQNLFYNEIKTCKNCTEDGKNNLSGILTIMT